MLWIFFDDEEDRHQMTDEELMREILGLLELQDLDVAPSQKEAS